MEPSDDFKWKTDKLENSLVTQAKNAVEIVVPWGNESVRPGAGFESRSMLAGSPWKTERSPFKSFEATDNYMIYEQRGDGRANYRSADSYSHGTSTAHYSGSLGVTVDAIFASASVTGSFDRSIQENTDSIKISRNNIVKAGMIQFARTPELNSSATITLRAADGEEKFRSQFGDYYLAGMILGGDSGTFLSVDENHTTTTDKTSVKVTVKVLFWSKSATTTHVSIHSTETIVVNLLGYDTLDHLNLHKTQIPAEKAVADIYHYNGLAENLETRVLERMRKLGIIEGKRLSVDHCKDICEAGLVVQLLMMPYHTLMSYQKALLMP